MPAGGAITGGRAWDWKVPFQSAYHMAGKLVLAVWFFSIRDCQWGCPYLLGYGSRLPQNEIQETNVETVVPFMTYPWKSHHHFWCLIGLTGQPWFRVRHRIWSMYCWGPSWGVGCLARSSSTQHSIASSFNEGFMENHLWNIKAADKLSFGQVFHVF